jgi:hypothetical protein
MFSRYPPSSSFIKKLLNFPSIWKSPLPTCSIALSACTLLTCLLIVPHHGLTHPSRPPHCASLNLEKAPCLQAPSLSLPTPQPLCLVGHPPVPWLCHRAPSESTVPPYFAPITDRLDVLLYLGPFVDWLNVGPHDSVQTFVKFLGKG